MVLYSKSKGTVAHISTPDHGPHQKAPKMFGFESQWGLRPGESENVGNREIP